MEAFIWNKIELKSVEILNGMFLLFFFFSIFEIQQTYTDHSSLGSFYCCLENVSLQ